MSRDFDIIVGGNTSLLKGDISSVLDTIGDSHPIKLKVFIENEDEITKQIGRISEKLRALGSVHVPTGKGSPVGNIEKDLSKAKVEASKLADNLDKAFGTTAKQADNANDKVEKLLKTTKKLDAESKKPTKVVDTKGNDFYTEKVSSTLKPEVGQVTPDFIEQKFDFKKLEKYIQEVKSDLDTWGKSVDSTGKKSKELKKILDSLGVKYKTDPTGSFNESVEQAKKLHAELSKVSDEIKEQEKLAKKLEEQFKKADLQMLKQGDLKSLNSGVNKVGKNASSMKDSDSYNFKDSYEEQEKAIREAVEANKTLKSKQDEIDRMSKQIAKNIQDWKENGVLTSAEISKLESQFKKLSRHSEDFESDIVGVHNKLKELNEKESEAIKKQNSQEEAKQKILKESVNWEEKINKLKEQGYYHNKQMTALESKISTLNDGQIRDLEQVNKLLKDIDNQYKKTSDYADKNKKQQSLNEDVKKHNKKLSNIDETLLVTPASKKDYGSMQKAIGSLSVDQSEKERKDNLSKITDLYDKLLTHQQNGINKLKEEAKESKKNAEEKEQQLKEEEKLKKHLEELEKKTAKEKLDTERELHEQQVRGQKFKEQQARENEALQKHLKGLDEKSYQERLKTERELHEQQVRGQKSKEKQAEDEKKLANQMANGRKGKSFESTNNEAKSSASRENKELERKAQNQARINEEVKEFNRLRSQIKSESMFQDNDIKKLDNMIRSLSNGSKNVEKDIKGVYSEIERINKAYSTINSTAERLNSEMAEMAQRDNFNEGDFQRVQQLMSRMNVNAESLESEIREINNEMKAVGRTITERDRAIESIQQRTERIGQSLTDSTNRALRSLERYPAELRQAEQSYSRLLNLHRQLASIDIGTETGREDYNRRHRELTDLINRANTSTAQTARNANAQTNSLFSRMSHAFKQVPIWMASMGAFYGMITQIKQGFQSILDIDKAMVGLAKVTDATNAELEEFRHLASGIGEDLGVLTADVINSTAEFQKLGYALGQSTALAENTILYANVGDMNIADATSYIVSSIKGFNVEVDKSGESVRKVIDIFNAVSNNYAISAEGIGQALQRSSAVLTQAGNSIEQSVALITSANTTIQDPMKVGNALKTISMRLRGVDEEGKKVVTLVPELEATFNRFGASIMENEDTFKTTFDIMDELKKNWHKLTDLEQANITELIGGKEQGSIVASMIANWGDALSSYETALDSAGSAQKEFEKYTMSFEYKINLLKISLEEFWVTLLDDDMLKNMIDGLTSVINLATNLVDIFGAIPTIIIPAIVTIAMLSKTVRGLIFDKNIMTGMRTSIGGMVDVAEDGTRRMTRDQERLRTGYVGIGKAIGHMAVRLLAVAGITLAVSLAIGGIYSLFTAQERKRQENIERLEDDVNQFEQLKEKMESLNINEYIGLDKRKNEGSLETEDYERYLELQREISTEMPDFIKGYDSEGNAILRNAEEIRDLIKEKERLYAIDQYDLAEEKIKGYDTSDLEEQIVATKALMNQSNYSEEEGDAYRFVRRWVEKNKDDLANGGSELDEEIDKLYSDLNGMLSDSNTNKTFIVSDLIDFTVKSQNSNEVEKVLTELDLNINKISVRTSRLAKQVDASRQLAEKSLNEYSTLVSDLMVKMINEEGVDTESGEFIFINELRDGMLNELFKLGDDVEEEAHAMKIPDRIKGVLEHAEKNNIDINKLFDFTLDAKVIEKEFDKFITSVNDGDKNAKTLIETLIRLKEEALRSSQAIGNSDLIPPVDPQSVNIMDGYIAKIGDLDGAYRTLSEGQKLSNQEVLNLIKSHPELNKSLTTQNGFLSINKDAIEAVANKHKESTRVQLQEARSSAEIAKNKAEINIKSIMSEVTALGILSSARREDAVSTMYSSSEMKGSDSIAEATAREKEYKNAINTYYDYADEINALNTTLNSLDSISLGSVTADPNKKSSSSKDKAKKEKKELEDAIYVADKYTLAMERLNNQIGIQQTIRDRMVQSSKAYRTSIQEELSLTNKKKKAMEDEIKSIEKQIKTKNIQQTGLISLNKKEDNKTARAKSAELAQELDELRGGLQDLKSEYQTVVNDSYTLSWSMVESNKAIYETQREEISDDMAYMEYMKSMYDENSTAFKKYSNEKLALLKINEKSYEDELKYLEKVKRNSSHLNPNQIIELNAMIREARENFYSATQDFRSELQSMQEIEIDFYFKAYTDGMDEFENAVTEIEDKLDLIDEKDWSGQIQSQEELASVFRGQVEYINDVISGLTQLRKEYGNNHELAKMIDDEIKSWENQLKSTKKDLNNAIKEIKQTYKQIADETVEIYKAGLQAQLDAENNAYDDLTKLHERAHEKKMAQYQKELDILSDIYDKQIEMINREDATRTYDNTLEKLQNDAKKLQKQIDILKLDDSYESILKQKELKEELDVKNEEITELNYEREKELRIESLEDAKDTETEKLEDKKEKLEDEHKAFMDSLEAQYNAKKRNLEAMLKDERYFAELRKSIMEGSLNEIASLMATWESTVGAHVTNLGNTVVNNFTDKVRKAIQEFEEMDKIAKNSTNNVNTVDKAVSNAQGGVNQNKDTWVIGGNSSGGGTSGGSSSSGSGSGGSGTSASFSSKHPYSSFSSPKTVKVVSSVGLFTNAEKTTKVRQLSVGESFKAYGEQAGLYDLGGGFSAKANFKVVSSTPATSGGSTASKPSTSGDSNSSTRYHTVKSGDTMSELAEQYYGKASSWNKIKNANPSINPNKMQIGTKLLIPFRDGGYTGNWSGDEGRVALLHKKEQILNEEQTLHIFDAVKSLEDAKRVKVSSSLDLNRDKSNDKPVVKEEHYHLTLDVENMYSDKKQADIMMEQMMKEVKRTKGRGVN